MKQILTILLLLLPLFSLGQSVEDEIVSLYDRSKSLYLKGDIYGAKKLGVELLNVTKKYYGEHNINYGNVLSCLALYACGTGDYAEALNYLNEALEIRHNDYDVYLLSKCHGKLGNYKEAVRLGTIVVENEKRGNNPRKYAGALSALGTYYFGLGDYPEAIKLEEKALSIRESLGKINDELVQSYANLANYNRYNQTYDQARYYIVNMVPIMELVYDQYSTQYTNTVNDLLFLLFVPNPDAKHDTVIKLQERIVYINKISLGTEHPQYNKSLTNLAFYYLVIGEQDKAVRAYQQSYQGKISYVLKNFLLMSHHQRAMMWKNGSDLICFHLPYIACMYPDPELSTLAYNGQLFSKGLTLNTEIEIQKLIEQKGDTAFANRYHRILMKQALLDTLYKTPAKKRLLDADSLAKVIEREENLLVQSSIELGDFQRNLSITFEDIQKKLLPNDLAIEFAYFRDSTAIVYSALVLKPGMKAPEAVKLFNLDSLNSITTSDIYKTSKLYNLIWKPLEKYLDGVKNVYFSPCAKLHSIGIEYLPDDDGNIFSEKFAAYRLSSTRELVINHPANNNLKAATFGGIQYDNSTDSSKIRDGVASYLVGTRVESEAIAKLLLSAQYNVTALSDTLATEASFKQLSGSDLKILHIATHGFYFAKDEMENTYFNFLLEGENTSENFTLSTSGLLFAGANAAFAQDRISNSDDGSEDGILTAKEISRLDFKGLDLVVLSACQSGLGEVTGEGVFGLQRGFKKAGARTLVMSLWNVSDDATQLLMTEFFKNLTSGMKKREAFVSAQKVVRQKFPHPGLWAAFIMVDGVE
ncbi:MAG: CHAT domain-containing protein [Bacteroidales bacterium]|nr:CHAT domain-containing protein [Bacteroidales bacterium]